MQHRFTCCIMKHETRFTSVEVNQDKYTVYQGSSSGTIENGNSREITQVPAESIICNGFREEVLLKLLHVELSSIHICDSDMHTF